MGFLSGLFKSRDALANAEEDAFLNGTGSGQPLGLFAEEGGGTVAETVTEIDADSLISLVYALKRPYRKNASFLINDANLAEIRKLKDNNGASVVGMSTDAAGSQLTFYVG